MPIRFDPMEQQSQLAGKSVFLSSSIPDPARWEGGFDALEITDAVVALARACLTQGVRLVTAAHPTIAPLLLYVAAEFPADPESRVTIYQSHLFDDVLPTATRRFEASGVGEVIWTSAADGDEPRPGSWDASLLTMRTQMLSQSSLSAAVFIGGMDGIRDEHALFNQLVPDRPSYPIGRPGGEARALVDDGPRALRDTLRDGDVYPALWRTVLADLAQRP